MAFAAALFGRFHLLDDNAEDLTVVRNDGCQSPPILGSTNSALEGIEDVLQAVVAVVRPQSLPMHVESD